MNNESIIDVQHLGKHFDGRWAVKDIDMVVKKGEVFGFLGPNGSGKTTTIRMLCGLLTPDCGEGTCLGYQLRSECLKIRAHVGYMTQKFSLYSDLTVKENLNFVARIYGIPARDQRVEAIIARLDLRRYINHRASALSGGWKQRLALAACLLHDPQLLLLDEPTAGVDPLARREFWDQIHALSEQGVTTLVSTHYMDEAERCTRLAYLAYGRLLITGTVEEVIAATQLKTWAITGAVSTALLAEARQLPGVMQAAFFGGQIHVCGFDGDLIEQGLQLLQTRHPDLQWQATPTMLEDAFISLVMQSEGDQR